MIQLKNVKKIYKSKKGSSTIALDDVNLKIENKGMLFIVGKSGSGKSTLLNLLGGLDNLTSGELLINGKNINNFNNKQYDSYRNTYIGFVFQEFNVLEQYNVYENIELALRLQNKKNYKDNINNLLEKLGLSNLGNRKINELSGGQKQRVAIARALIKKPKIILADEPTGNLDKNSSEQIFNILKEISKNQLVIIVSHDMESAEKYADRIIQIEDGKVISDSKPVQNIDIGIFELKKSKLPFLYALKMAINSFKVKPIKLIMTIILTAISLIFMGFTVNCSLFDRTMLVVNTMKDNNNYVYDVQNSEFGIQGSKMSLSFEDKDIKNIQEITNSIINPVYSLYDNGDNLKFEFGENNERTSYYQLGISTSQFVEIKDSNILGKIIGSEPTKYNEIVVHKYFADYAIKFGIMDSNDKLYFPKNYNELINSKKEIKLGQNKVIIVGIIDDDNSLFIKAQKNGKFDNKELETYFLNKYAYKGIFIYVKGFTENVTLQANKEALLNNTYFTDGIENENRTFFSENMKYLNNEISIITNSGIENINSLEKNKVVISIEALKKFDKEFDSKFNKYIASSNGGNYDTMLINFISEYLIKDSSDLNMFLNIYFKEDVLNGINNKVDIYGISLDNNNYISYKYAEEYKPILKQIYSIKIFDNNINNLTKSLNKLIFNDYSDSDDMKMGTYYTYTVDVDANHDLSNIMGIYKGLSIYILIVSLVFVLFTFLLFSNFISISISYCKKEIGILRALGATNKDVIKIFGYESLIIAVISWIVSIIGWFIVCNILNNSLFGNMYYILNGIVKHPFVPIIMFIYTITIAILITVVSINRITKIKPIDAILNK